MYHRPAIDAHPRHRPAPARHHPVVLLLAALLLATCLGTAGAPALAGPVNINAADAATLASELKGVGKVKAQALLDFRQKHGPFRSVDELAQVKGFSQKLIERNRADIKLGPVAATAASQGGHEAVRATPPKASGAASHPASAPKARR
jgi:competence protein ComEA